MVPKTRRIVKHYVSVDELAEPYRREVGVPAYAELTTPRAVMSRVAGQEMLLHVEFVWEWDDE